MMPKVAAIRREADRRGLNLDIQVDGGISEKTIAAAAKEMCIRDSLISSRKGKNEGKGPNRGGENAGNASVFKGYRNFN